MLRAIVWSTGLTFQAIYTYMRTDSWGTWLLEGWPLTGLWFSRKHHARLSEWGWVGRMEDPQPLNIAYVHLPKQSSSPSQHFVCDCSFCKQTNSETILQDKNKDGYKKNDRHHDTQDVPVRSTETDTKPRLRLQKRLWEHACPTHSATETATFLSWKIKCWREKYFFRISSHYLKSR